MSTTAPPFDSPAQLSALEALHVPFVSFSTALQPQFISVRAAELLNIRERSNLVNYGAQLEPLRDFAASVYKRSRTAIMPDTPFLTELTLCADGGRSFSAFTFAALLAQSQELRACASTPQIIVIFHDLTLYEPLFRSIQQSRRIRTLIVLVSSLFGGGLALGPDAPDLIQAYASTEAGLFRAHSANVDNIVHTDLLPALSKTVEIVDPLILSSAKVLMQAKTSALLAISQPNFLRIACHLLLEALDFAGPFGTAKIQAAIKENTLLVQGRPAGSYQSVELIVSGHGQTQLPLQASPVDLLIYRCFTPVQYKVFFSRESSAQDTQAQSLSAQEIPLGSSAAPTGEKLSDNLLIASHIAGACGVPLALRRPEPGVMLLTCQLRLARG